MNFSKARIKVVLTDFASQTFFHFKSNVRFNRVLTKIFCIYILTSPHGQIIDGNQIDSLILYKHLTHRKNVKKSL